MTVRLDSTPHSVLAVCACGWRSDAVTTRAAAWRQARAHCDRAHIGEPVTQQVSNALVQLHTRAAR